MKDRRYYFLRSWRQFSMGDPVPDNFDAGMIQSMAQVGIIGCPKDTTPERDKMVRSAKRKAATV